MEVFGSGLSPGTMADVEKADRVVNDVEVDAIHMGLAP